MKTTNAKPMNGLPAIHHGEFLRETLDELAMTQVAFADAIGVSAMRVSHVLKLPTNVFGHGVSRVDRAYILGG